MILLIDIGNTSIVIGAAESGEVRQLTRMHTEKLKSADEYAAKLLASLTFNSIKKSNVTGSIISSVVPELTFTFSEAIERICGVSSVIVGERNHGCLKCDIIPLKYLGADLICGCVGAIENYSLPAIVVDMGTATKLLAIDEGGHFLGCVIAPGMKTALNSLTERASLLPEISLTVPKSVLGTDTVECMQSGSVFGNAAMIDGLLSRICREKGWKEPTIIATGGYIKYILPCCETELNYDENLILKGLKAIYESSDVAND